MTEVEEGLCLTHSLGLNILEAGRNTFWCLLSEFCNSINKSFGFIIGRTGSESIAKNNFYC